MKDTVGPFVMLEFVGGPEDGETLPQMWPVPHEFLVPRPLGPAKICSPGEPLMYEPTLMIGRYALTQRPHEFAKCIIASIVWDTARMSLEQLMRITLRGKPTLQFDWESES